MNRSKAKKRAKAFLWAAAILLAGGCDTKNLGEIYLNPQTGKEEGCEESHLWACAVSFPKGYDWRKDSLGTASTSDLLLFRDTECILKLSCNSLNRVSADADRHYIVGGQLYTVYPTSSDCIVKKNGQEAFRIGRRELITDLIVRDSCIFTLGTPPSGKGWIWRKDGQELLQRDDGEILGGMYTDKDSICFAFVENIGGSTTSVTSHRYYCVRETEVSQLKLGTDIEEVLSIRMNEGVLNYLAVSSAVKNGVLWQQGPNAYSLGAGRLKKIRNFALDRVGKEIVAHGFELTGQVWTHSFWASPTAMETNTKDVCERLIYCSDSPVQCYSWYNPDSGRTFVVWNASKRDYTGDFRVVSPYVLAGNESGYAIGMSEVCAKSYTGDLTEIPVIVTPDDTLRFNFNGYFTRLSF